MSWTDLVRGDPSMAAYGAERLTDRVAYLATVGTNGRPRVFPVSPLLCDDRLFLYMYPTSPKGHDLERGDWYALHCSVEDDEGGAGEFSVRGIAHRIMDQAVWDRVRPGRSAEFNTRFVLFELDVLQAFTSIYREGVAERRSWPAAAPATVVR